jgi:hypothetical protein
VKIADFSDGEMPHFFNIDSSVGVRCANRHDDVALIQHLLRSLSPFPENRNGLALVLFEKDRSGVFGPETRERLRKYLDDLRWRHRLPLSNPDDPIRPIEEADLKLMKEKKANVKILMELNLSVYQQNWRAFSPDKVRHHVPHLKK